MLAARLPKPPPYSVDGPISVVRERAIPAPPPAEVADVEGARPLSPTELALACREAGLSFLDGVATGWRKRDLAEWLEIAYRPLTVDARDDDAPPAETGAVASETLDRVMQRAHDAVVAALVRLADGDWEAVMRAMQREHVVSTRIGETLVWVPADRARMTLEARVLSLFLADYLVADAHFDGLRVAPCCSAVSFEGDGGPSPCHCHRAARPSHIRDLAPR